jgi:hypothetical protein
LSSAPCLLTEHLYLHSQEISAKLLWLREE